MESARRDDNIVSPQGLVCQCKTKAKQRTTQSAIQKSVSQEATKETKAPPQPGASRSQSASRTGNILTDSWIQSRSLSGCHVSTSFLDPVLGAMMKQVCWHSRRSKAYRGLPEARMAASRLLRMCRSSRGLPRLLLAPFTASEK